MSEMFPEETHGEPLPPPRRTGLITASVVAHFIFSLLTLLCGCGLGVTAFVAVELQDPNSAVSDFVDQSLAKDKEPEKKKQEIRQFSDTIAPVAGLFWGMAAGNLLLVPLALTAAIGLLRRKQWGWVLSIASGILAVALALGFFGVSLALNGKDPTVPIVYFGYGSFLIIAMLNPGVKAEFAPR